MLMSCTKEYTDESNEQSFRFTFYCDRCGEPHSAAPLEFTASSSADTDCEKELWELRWQKEHSRAFERANHEAAYHFFCCPGCGEYVCRDCTVSEKNAAGDVRDLCRRCSRREKRRKTLPMKIIPPPVLPPGKTGKKQKGWHGIWKNKGFPRSPDE